MVFALSRSETSALPERLCQFSNLEPANFRRFNLGAIARDALGELGEAIVIAGVEVGIGQRRFVRRNLGLQALDFAREPIIVALILVGELVPRRRPGSGSAITRCFGSAL